MEKRIESNGHKNNEQEEDKDKAGEIDDSNSDHPQDHLEFLFRKQTELFSKQLNNTENKMANIYKRNEPFDGYRLFMLSTALIHEAIELQRETNWKWWKKEGTLDNSKIQEEIIDIWHFLLQISIEAGLNPESVVEKYSHKNKENLDRQVKGY
ncbi:MAG: dUTPase [Thermoproteota archaeon]|nr:dUTPase [Thermoproteota archaeon]